MDFAPVSRSSEVLDLAERTRRLEANKSQNSQSTKRHHPRREALCGRITILTRWQTSGAFAANGGCLPETPKAWRQLKTHPGAAQAGCPCDGTATKTSRNGSRRTASHWISTTSDMPTGPSFAVKGTLSRPRPNGLRTLPEVLPEGQVEAKVNLGNLPRAPQHKGKASRFPMHVCACRVGESGPGHIHSSTLRLRPTRRAAPLTGEPGSRESNRCLPGAAGCGSGRS